MGKGPHVTGIRIAEIGNPIYYKTDKREIGASGSTKAAGEGGRGAPASCLRRTAALILIGWIFGYKRR